MLDELTKCSEVEAREQLSKLLAICRNIDVVFEPVTPVDSIQYFLGRVELPGVNIYGKKFTIIVKRFHNQMGDGIRKKPEVCAGSKGHNGWADLECRHRKFVKTILELERITGSARKAIVWVSLDRINT